MKHGKVRDEWIKSESLYFGLISKNFCDRKVQGPLRNEKSTTRVLTLQREPEPTNDRRWGGFKFRSEVTTESTPVSLVEGSEPSRNTTEETIRSKLWTVSRNTDNNGGYLILGKFLSLRR